VREVAYERAAPGVRARLHRRFARALECDSDDGSHERLSALAHHYGRSLLGGDAEKAINSALHAGDRALAGYALEEAARHYESALDAIEAGEPRDLARAALAAQKAARAHALCARSDEARTLAARAVEAARASGSASAFREAVVVACDVQPSYGRDRGALRLLDEALASASESDLAARAQLLSQRGMMAFLDADLAAHDSASAEALALARSAGDSAALLEALRVRCFGLNHPATEREWRRLCDERVALAERDNDAMHAFHARTQRIDHRLQTSDLRGVDGELRALEALAARIRSPKLEATLLGIRAGLAISAGPPAEARRLAERAFAIGKRIDYGEWWATAQLQLSAILGFEDRAGEASAGVRRGTHSHAQVSLFHAGEIWLQCLAGREAEAHARLREVAKDRFAALRRDVSTPVTLASLALSCGHLGSEEAADGLRELLRPYAGRNLTVLCWYSAGSASRYLGIVESALGAWDAAAAHFESALATERANGARVWEAHVAIDYARMLLAQGGARRAAHARVLASGALASSGQLGIVSTARVARELLGASGA
jgi:tetratricopeptide (TPR) repeat protein